MRGVVADVAALVVFNFKTQRSIGRRNRNNMKKIIYVCALVAIILFGAVDTASAKTIAKDTVEYNGAWKMERVEKVNDYGEISVRYVCYLLDIVNSKGEPRKVTTDKVTYESDDVTHIIYNIQDTGAKRISKAVNVEAVHRAKAAKYLTTASE